MNSKDELGGMRELTSFKVDHSCMGNLIILRTSFVDTPEAIGLENVPVYPDQDLMIRLSMAKLLVLELQKRIDYIEAGIKNTQDH
ncbi:hypothetical protein I7V28_22570 [Lelliottia amnigena]|jgi:hypothetical protein|uniref:hypothetical protein n=1 Tax=Lelliottia TaxID=1330545 RepID=UPI00192B2107|nr:MULTISPECIES: hypothetical protein [Lelliottia]MBL5884875.1 hypothetical protein [Lelliottia aquatilis]MBL5923862.1 hypothetical protein [Lelliottia amnigena]MBL5932707.1 hypothetical protein [Lelliottia amnigena]